MCKTLLEIMEPEINKIVDTAIKKAEKETAKETTRKIVEQVIRKGKMTVEEIADCTSVLSVSEVKKLEAEIMQMA